MPNEADLNRTLLTPEGKKKLEDELYELKNVKRLEIAEEIKTARGFGDLSENAEYDEAKNAQAVMESRIAEIENLLRNAVVVDSASQPSDVVIVGRKVRVYDLEYDEEDEYTIVGTNEANPIDFLISTESPIGQALMGHHVGETVDVNAPGGIIKLKILEVKPA